MARTLDFDDILFSPLVAFLIPYMEKKSQERFAWKRLFCFSFPNVELFCTYPSPALWVLQFLFFLALGCERRE